MATIGIYADDEYMDRVDRLAHDLRISKSQLTRLAFDSLMGLTPPSKFGLDEVKPESCRLSKVIAE